MPAHLRALSEGPNILLDKPILLLGRHPECDVQIDSRKISRRHCCIAQVNDYLVVRDLGSTNGIRINGGRVSEGRLRHGDELMIGNHRYQVSWEDQAPAAVVGPPRDTIRATAEPPADDELLESCDEPVPLAETGKPLAPVAPTPRSPVGKPPESSSILPDHIDLRPPSDVFNLPGT